MSRISVEVVDLTGLFLRRRFVARTSSAAGVVGCRIGRGPPIRNGQLPRPLRTFLGVWQGRRLSGRGENGLRERARCCVLSGAAPPQAMDAGLAGCGVAVNDRGRSNHRHSRSPQPHVAEERAALAAWPRCARWTAPRRAMERRHGRGADGSASARPQAGDPRGPIASLLR